MIITYVENSVYMKPLKRKKNKLTQKTYDIKTSNI